MRQIREEVVDSHADIWLLVIDAVKTVALEQRLDICCGAISYHDVAAYIQEYLAQSDLHESVAKVCAPVLALSVQR